MAEELKDSGTVTALSVIGLVFGLIGMLGSFIPCIGSLAFYIGIPAAIISAIALGIAYSQKAKNTFAIVALTISLIGVVISGWQFFSIMSAGQKAREEIQKMSQPYIQPKSNSDKNIAQQQEKPGPKIEELSSTSSNNNKVEARKLFYDAYLPLLKDKANIGKIYNDNKWIKKEIVLIRGSSNLLQIEMQQYDMHLFKFYKRYKRSIDCGKTMTREWLPEALKTDGNKFWYHWTSQDAPYNLCEQFIFEPFYEDTKLFLYLPKDFQDDFKITLKDAKLVN